MGKSNQMSRQVKVRRSARAGSNVSVDGKELLIDAQIGKFYANPGRQDQ